MNDLVVFILGTWGLTHLLISGKIFDRPRNWLFIRSEFFSGLLSCYQCTGFWAGLIISYYFTSSVMNMLLLSALSSGTCSLINSLYVWMNAAIQKMQNDSNKTF